MAKLLRSLKINRVDLVDRGANPDANVVLFKREDDGRSRGRPKPPVVVAKDKETLMDLDKLRALLKPEPTTAAFMEKFTAFHVELKKESEHLGTFDDAMMRRNLGRVMGRMNDFQMALFETVERITSSDHAEKTKLVKDAIKAFVRRVGSELPRFIDETMAKGDRRTKLETLLADIIREGEGTMTEVNKDKKTEPAKPDMGALRKMFGGMAKVLGFSDEEVAKIDPETGDDIWKGVSPALRTRIEASEAATTAEVKKREEAEKRVSALEVEKAMAATTEELKTYGNLGLDPVKDAELFQKMTTGMTTEQVARVREIFKGADAKIATGKIYTELGSAGAGVPTDSATAEVVKRVNELQAKAENVKASEDELMQRVFAEDHELYERYRKENAIKV